MRYLWMPQRIWMILILNEVRWINKHHIEGSCPPKKPEIALRCAVMLLSTYEQGRFSIVTLNETLLSFDNAANEISLNVKRSC